MLLDMIEAFGSPIVVDGKAALDRDKMIEAMRFWSELYTKYKVAPPSAPNDSYRQIMEGFRTGQTAMIWHHTGSLTEIAEALPARRVHDRGEARRPRRACRPARLRL